MKYNGLKVFFTILFMVIIISTFTAYSMAEMEEKEVKGNLTNNIACNKDENSDFSKVKYMGRFDFSDPNGPKFSWSASTIKANFIGTSIGIKIKRYNTWHENFLGAIVDGGELIKLKIDEDGIFEIKTKLSKKRHTIEIIKMDEGMSGDLQFLGFEIENGKLLNPPKDSKRKIEFIGDSITCGYGIETDDPEAPWGSNLCNTYTAYPAITARNLEADFSTICWSGTGIYRNWEGKKEEVMPIYYWRTLSKDPENLWNFKGKDPQILVINLHTNDFSVGIPDRKEFTDSYKNFINEIRKEYKCTYIYCVVGGMIYGDKLISAREYVENGVVGDLNNSGDKKIGYFEFSGYKEEYGFGGGWHPSSVQHQIMADELTKRIEKDFKW
ncbi:MAG: SGNH/GDSL hydrolase family protein [Clostridiales bacterium]